MPFCARYMGKIQKSGVERTDDWLEDSWKANRRLNDLHETVHCRTIDTIVAINLTQMKKRNKT